MDFNTKLQNLMQANNSLLCIGLDPDPEKLPTTLSGSPDPFFFFFQAIVDATADLVCAYKPNSAFYEAHGAAGVQSLKNITDYIRTKYPEIPIILDFKRGDIGNTNNKYAQYAFEYLGVDAITIQPYQGHEAVQSYLDYKDKGVFILCRTSNDGAGEFQDLEVDGKKLYEVVAANVTNHWNASGNCGLVVGATSPDELAKVRNIVGDVMNILVPGIGAQGGDIEATIKAGKNSTGGGMLINSARDILYASPAEDFADAARHRAKLTVEDINKYRS